MHQQKGAILSQRQNVKEVVIAYVSRTLSSAESNYGITELECLATSLGSWIFLIIPGTEFTVVTNHHACKDSRSIQQFIEKE
jgi:hypothetical protein